MLLNGAVLDLRATHDGGGFPLTGYPATDVASWKRIIGICKAWGLNGMRFHSWCPPEAAFTAADELGLLPAAGVRHVELVRHRRKDARRLSTTKPRGC